MTADMALARELIGSMFDTDVSKITGASVAWVRKMRIAEGVGPYVQDDPLAQFDPLLATMTDEALGKIAGVTKQAITARRKAKGQISYRDLQRSRTSADD